MRFYTICVTLPFFFCWNGKEQLSGIDAADVWRCLSILYVFELQDDESGGLPREF